MSGTERIENDGGRTLEEGQPNAGPAPEDPAQEEAQFEPEHARLDLNAEQWDDE